MLRHFTLLAALSISFPLHAVEPESTQRLANTLKPFVEDKTVAGLIAVVADEDSIIDRTVLGYADVAAGEEMRSDAIFWIASMTKPVTAACVMMLVDEGKLSLDDPIVKHLPVMAGLKTSDGKSVTITLRQLLTHTSGMSELPPGEAYSPPTLQAVAERYAQLPLQFEPGSKWQYSQTSINTAARIVEVVSGMSFDTFVQQRVCEPLGMNDTTFYLSDEQLPRLATSYAAASGELVKDSIRILGGKSPASRDRFPAANGGLFSTADDYTRFCQMLLNDGELNGQRLLSEDAVETMRTIATGELKPGFTPGNGWGIGVCVVREPQGVTEPLSAGSFGHGGAYGTQAWIDPQQNRIYLLMTQRSDFPNSDASAVRAAFMKAGAGLAAGQ